MQIASLILSNTIMKDIDLVGLIIDKVHAILSRDHYQ